MATRIFVTADFEKFSGKARIEDVELVEAIERVERGLVDADLGGGVLKLRVPRPVEGRRGGYRAIVACVIHRRAFFVFGFGKNSMDNIDRNELRRFRLLGELLHSLGESDIAASVAGKKLREIER